MLQKYIVALVITISSSTTAVIADTDPLTNFRFHNSQGTIDTPHAWINIVTKRFESNFPPDARILLSKKLSKNQILSFELTVEQNGEVSKFICPKTTEKITEMMKTILLKPGLFNEIPFNPCNRHIFIDFWKSKSNMKWQIRVGRLAHSTTDKHNTLQPFP